MNINFIKARNQLRTLSAISAVVLMSGAGSAWASVDVSGENNTTGFSSTNDNTYDVIDTVDLDVENDADVDNDADITVDTGNNDVRDNTTVEDITGGDIDVQGEFVNELNSESMDLSMSEFGDVSADFTNDTTGSSSSNTNDLNVNRSLDVDVDNDSDIDNDIDATLSSGGNSVRDNTTVGDVTSGDIDFSVNVENMANQNASDVVLPDFGSMDVNGNFANDTTGSGSSNSNTVTVTDTVDVEIDNDADVDNDLDVTGDSGNNDIRRNTKVGDITTGSQSYVFTYINDLN